ncbi:MAG: hypothetical protein CME70_11950 [Halobacteriovorax sp.]|nr:hypothetical protein [Halobacteriovorax sp.]|tara:strand:- start:321525 stop:322400 length:876 start_codon:yes stop_codon:yes gene_type:complete
MITIDLEDPKAVEAFYKKSKDILLNKMGTKKFRCFSMWLEVNSTSLKELLTADYMKLLALLGPLSTARPKYPYKDFKNDMLKAYRALSSSKNKRSFSSLDFVNSVGIRVCPYCNRNFVFNASSRNRTCELDHFFNKDEFPFFALSFFNLVPSCGLCNRYKSTREIDISPYDNNVDWTSHYKFNLEIKKSTILSVNDFDFRLEVLSKEFSLNANCFRLEELYECHKEEVLELLNRKQIFCKSQIDEIREKYKGLIPSRKQANKIIFGHGIDKKNLQKTPLCKMLSDIFESDE